MASVQKPEESSQPQKAFTVKAILFGLLGIVLVAGLAYFNENRLTQNLMIGNHFPITVFFYIFCLALFWNLLCSKLMPFLALRTGELTVTLSMILAACWAPTSGLFRYFHRLLILPWHFLPQKPLWIKTNVLDYIPAKLLPLGESVHEIVSKTLSGELSKVDPNLKVLYDRVYDGFVKGIGQGDQIVWNFPIKEWLSPMIYWGPMFIIFAACTLGLALLVHRQWAHHEQLSYPLASIADGVIKTSPGRLCSDIFSERLFWWGAVPVLTIHAFNYLAMWFPNAVPNIALSWNCNNGVQDIFPILKQSGMYNVHTGTLFFTILGIAYFIPSEVGLSLGLSSFILAFIGAQFYMMTGKPIAGQDLDNFRAGAYIGYALILLYTGRSYYFPVILKAFGLGRKGFVCEKESIMAARIVVLGFLAMVAILMVMGLNWLVALVFTLFLFLLFLVFTRVVCETGVPFLQASWLPGTFMCELAGPAAIGAGPLVFIFYLGAILTQDPRECLMPYAATSFKVADDNNVGRRKLLFALLLGIGASLAIGFFATLWENYNYGAMSSDNWANDNVCKMYFDKAARQLSFMEETGQLASNNEESPLKRLSHINLTGGVMSWVLGGGICVIILSLLRFRFSKCPLHPVLFLVLGTFPIMNTYASFLLGWGAKQLIVKFGGGKAYNDLKPLFIGIIMGELLAGGISILIGFTYYFSTGLLPVAFKILPS